MTGRTGDTSFSSRADKPALHVIVSLDVEEEGLFSGSYAAEGCGVPATWPCCRLNLTSRLGFP